MMLRNTLLIAAISFGALNAARCATPGFSSADYAALEQATPRLAEADHALNRAYHAAESREPGDARRTILLEQRSWIRARDTNAAAVGPIGSPAFIESLIEQTQSRASELDHLATETPPIPASEPAGEGLQQKPSTPQPRVTSAPQMAGASAPTSVPVASALPLVQHAATSEPDVPVAPAAQVAPPTRVQSTPSATSRNDNSSGSSAAWLFLGVLTPVPI